MCVCGPRGVSTIIRADAHEIEKTGLHRGNDRDNYQMILQKHRKTAISSMEVTDIV